MINGKKALLILGAISAMVDIVKNAKNKGYYVIVTDYYEDSPAKKYADESWMFSIDDVDGIVDMARKRGVDGVMNYCIDPVQKPYQEICEKLSLPCVAGFEQFEIMTNKDKFGECCLKYGVGTIPTYEVEDFSHIESLLKVDFPVVVKPVDGRASKGISICTDVKEVNDAVKIALDHSKRKVVRIEKYLQCPEICVKYFACDGEFYLSTMADVYKCFTEEGEKVYLGTQTYPSRFLKEYLETTHGKVLNMLKSIGIKNGAMSLTGFYDNGVFRFFDPSLRMGGAQDWCIAAAASGIDISDCLTEFAMCGRIIDKYNLKKLDCAIANKPSALLYFDIGVGTIGYIDGITEASMLGNVVGYHMCHKVGDEIKGLGTSDNVAVRFIVSADTTLDLVKTIEKIQSIVSIKDINGDDMVISPFDSSVLLEGSM